jgi:hypothetical protein
MSNVTTSTWQSDTWRRPFAQNVPPESEELSGSSPRGGVNRTSTFDEAAFLDEATEILLVKSNAG